MDQGARLAAELNSAFGLEGIDRVSALMAVRQQLDAELAVGTAALDATGAFEGGATGHQRVSLLMIAESPPAQPTVF